jgi:TetR/AcrR family transcriptional repressor of nem operon
MQVGRLVIERGYDAVSLDDVQRLTGLGRGSIYQAFGSKAGLIARAMDAVAARGSADADQLTAVILASSAISDPEIMVRLTRQLQAMGSTPEQERRLGGALLTRIPARHGQTHYSGSEAGGQHGQG